MSVEQIESIIAAEKDAETPFNRFALGLDFFKLRRRADELLTEKYKEKFGRKPRTRPYFAVLGEFDRTMGMYRQGRRIRIDVSLLVPENVTFMYPDHFHLVWSKGLFLPETPYCHQPFHDLLFTYAELPEAIRTYNLDDRIEEAKRRDMWTGSYIEAHIWDPDIKLRVRGLDEP